MTHAGTIQVLSETVINKIAAGEVVERPASVLKELAENAIDAGPTRLVMEVTAGGRKLVAVEDDGTGMNRDNAMLAIERHATSKIRDVDDIETIDTLGFRGEALAAIASVSRFRLITAPHGETAGTEILISGGKIQDVQPCSAAPGTRIEVRDLFFNVPARRKFLRSAQTELAHLRRAFLVLALSHPEIAMTLRVDDHELYRLPAGGAEALTDRIRDLFGADTLRQLRPLDYTAGAVRVRGFAGLPAFNRADRSEQYTFVNGRATSAPVVAYALREGYRTLLPGDRHPVVFLFVDLPPGDVDVNVHPAKREVRFRRAGDVRDAVTAAIAQALGAGRPAVAREAAPPDAPPARPAATAIHLPIRDLPAAHTFRYPRLPAADRPASADTPTPAADAPGADAAAGGDAPRPAAATPWDWCRVVGQVGELYVVLEIEDGLVLMDPHAAHERVLFERFMAAAAGDGIATQPLLMPESVSLPPGDADRVRRHLDLLRRLGIGVDDFGGDHFVVDALPAFLPPAPARDLLIEISHELEHAGARRADARLKEAAVAQAACQAAVKTRDALTLQEIEALVVDLARTTMPYTCPHGRPTLVYMSFRELNRKFGRA